VNNFITIICEENWVYMFNFYNMDLFKKSVVNMGIRLYNKVPDHIKDLEN
jgi:hypothetical protein